MSEFLSFVISHNPQMGNALSHTFYRSPLLCPVSEREFKTPFQMDADESPRQMLGRIMGLTPAGIAKGRTPPDGGNGNHRQRAASPLLEHVRTNQIQAQAHRTATRLNELQQEKLAKEAERRSRVMENRTSPKALEEDIASPMFSGTPLRSDSLIHQSSMAMPATQARRNITQRRSRDRGNDGGTDAPQTGRVARRPRGRSRDRRYSVESTGAGGQADCERQDWRSAQATMSPPSNDGVIYNAYPVSRIMHAPVPLYGFDEGRISPMSGEDDQIGSGDEEGAHATDLAYRVPSSTSVRSYASESSSEPDVSIPFRRDQIPPQTTHPVLHKHLTQLWYDRQEAVRALGDALGEDNLVKYGQLQCDIAHLNEAMHAELQRVQPKDEDKKSSGSSESGESEDSESRFQQVDNLPLPADSSSKKRVKKSFKETGEDAFTILLSYQGVVGERFVTNSLPMRVLYTMARSYLQAEFHFKIESESELDLYYNGQLLRPVGSLGNVPILAGAIIDIRYPRKAKSSSTPSRRIKPTPKAKLPTAREPDTQCMTSPDEEDLYDTKSASPSHMLTLDSRSYDKIRQSFKCPRFSGQAREWKQWDKGFLRYLSIWELDYVLDPAFFDVLPLTASQRRDNKLVYYIIEDAVHNSPLAASYVKTAALNNGFEAYYTLHDGYVFAGATTATLLLNELSNFWFLPNETPTELCLRLEELFQELKTLPGDAAVTFIDTQQIGYLINALRHEKEWEHVCSTITSLQIKGGITFRDACAELRVRCETTRANEIMDRPIKGKKVKGLMTQPVPDVEKVTEQFSEQIMGLISTMAKRQNAALTGSSPDDIKGNKTDKKGKKKYVKQECLAADCAEMTTFPLCALHYHSLVSAKTPTLKLRQGYGDASFDAATNLIVYPPTIPASRLPTSSTKALAASPQ